MHGNGVEGGLNIFCVGVEGRLNIFLCWSGRKICFVLECSED